MAQTRTSTLSNGMTVITRQHDSKQAYAELMIGVGSRDESPEEGGCSHILEHMLCADAGGSSLEERAREVKHMRGTSNAATTEEWTSYEYYVNKNHLPRAIDMLGESLLQPLLSPGRLKTELEAIQEERREYLNDPGDILSQLLLKTALPGSGLDKPIDGTEESIYAQTPETLRAFMNKHYSGDKMVLTVVGDVDHDAIVAKAEETFAGVPHTVPEPIARQQSAYRGGMMTHASKESEQVMLTIGFEGSCSEDIRGDLCDSLISNILSGGFESPLFAALRNETGLVYDVSAVNEDYSDAGIFSVSLATSGKKVGKAVDALCKALVSFPDSITQDQLTASIDHIAGVYERASERTDSIGFNLGRSAISGGRPADYDEKLALLENITLEEVRQRAREIFATAPSVAAYGKGLENLPSYEEISRKLGHERQLGADGLVKLDMPTAARSLAGAELVGEPAQTRKKAI